MRRALAWFRGLFRRVRKPTYVITVYFCTDDIYQWTVGMVYDVPIANSRAIVTGFDYPLGEMYVGVWT